MRTSLGLLSLVLVGLLGAATVPVGTAQADATTATTKTHHHHRIHGKIMSIDGTSITIKVHHHHKKGTAATGTANPSTAATTETKTFKLDANVKVFRGNKSAKTAAATTDLKVGDHVAIGEHEGIAHEIKILPKHHKKKTTTAAT